MSTQMHVLLVRAGNIRRCHTVAEGARQPMHKNAPQRKTAFQATRIAHKRRVSRMSTQMHVSFVRAGNIRRCPTVAEGARRPMHKNAPQRKTASKPLGSHTDVRCPE